jgi:DNA polymerase III psi subunit
MNDTRHLPYLIHEQIFKVNEPDVAAKKESIPQAEDQSNLPQQKKATEKVPLIVYSAPLTETSTILLEKILKAIQLDLKQVALLSEKDESFESNRILMFGSVISVRNEIPLYQLTETNGQEFLQANTLDIIADSVEEKTKLWTELKSWFKV